MESINEQQLIQYFWSNPSIRKKIQSEYNLNQEVKSSNRFSEELILALKQPVRDVFRNVSNIEVFEAAVKSLGSNSRHWGTFSSREKDLKELLESYNPIKVYTKWDSVFENQVKSFFPGQTRKNDVTAVFQWSKKLANAENFYKNYILKLSSIFLTKASERGMKINVEKIMLLICGFCANPPQNTFLVTTNYVPTDYKFFGMGYILSSEFLRNLGWNGFKPDRHIKRLFDYWYDTDVIFQQTDIHFYNEMLNSRKKDLNDFIKYSLIGHQITPNHLKYSEIDNLIWAFGAYVAKKGKESDFPMIN